MRYIILKDSNAQWLARKQYLFHATKLWTYMLETEEAYELVSIPKNAVDVLFIVGHNIFVNTYIKQHKESIREKNIVLISCSKKCHYKAVTPPQANVYICHQDANGEATLYDGSPYSFSFNITESELLFFNCKEPDIYTKLEKSFTKL